MSVSDALAEQNIEYERMLANLDKYDREGALFILASWVGTKQLKDMNNFLEETANNR